VAIELKERFSVAAPIDAVWRFVMDAKQVVTCMPGATLDEVVDDRAFLGSVQVKLGAVTTRYKGRVQFTEVDEQAHVVSSRLSPLPDGQTEIVAEAKVDLTGRIVQVGRGMIQGVSHQLFQQFAASTKQHLERPPGSAPLVAESTPIRIVPLVLRTVWFAIIAFFRRLFGRPLSER
jgi:carbon monoxide dehydrogenase subunit G